MFKTAQHKLHELFMDYKLLDYYGLDSSLDMDYYGLEMYLSGKDL